MANLVQEDLNQKVERLEKELADQKDLVESLQNEIERLKLVESQNHEVQENENFHLAQIEEFKKQILQKN